MNDNQRPLKTQKLAVGGMTCVNCEFLVARRLKEIPGIEDVRVNHAGGCAEIDYRGDLDIVKLQLAVAEDGYFIEPWDKRTSVRGRNTARDYAEITGILAILVGVAFALQHFGLMPRGFAVSEGMT